MISFKERFIDYYYFHVLRKRVIPVLKEKLQDKDYLVNHQKQADEIVHELTKEG